jgi:hypothetical protein
VDLFVEDGELAGGVGARVIADSASMAMAAKAALGGQQGVSWPFHKVMMRRVMWDGTVTRVAVRIGW